MVQQDDRIATYTVTPSMQAAVPGNEPHKKPLQENPFVRQISFSMPQVILNY